MCKEALHQAGMSAKLTMTCDDCAESMDGKPFGSCCAMCEERIRALDPPLDFDDEERVVEAMEAGHGVRYDTGKRRFYGDEATALADHLELSGALELLKDVKAREAKLAEALKVAKSAMRERWVCNGGVMPGIAARWIYENRVVESALKEWEAGK